MHSPRALRATPAEQERHDDWPLEDLGLIGGAAELGVAPLRGDRSRYAVSTTIWAVLVDDQVYVRARRGMRSHWYRLATAAAAVAGAL